MTKAEYYKTNNDFKNYVDRYATTHRLTTDEALEHDLVNSAYEYYMEESKCDIKEDGQMQK